MQRTALVAVVGVLGGVLACANPFAPPPEPPAPAPPPVPADPTRSERTGAIDPVSLGVLEQSEKGCHFYVALVPGEQLAPVARLAGECPGWFELAWDKEQLVLLADGVPMRIHQREATVLPAPEHSSAIALRGTQLVVCGSGDENWVERDGKVTFTSGGKRFEADQVEGASDYALARRYVWADPKWVDEAVGVVPVFPEMSDAACTALPGWPGGSRLDPGEPRWNAADWTTAYPSDDGHLSQIAGGSWWVDPTRTVAVRGVWVGQAFTSEGPVALWLNGAWKPIEDTRRPGLVFSLAPDWLLYDSDDGDSRLVSRRDGSQTWGHDDDAPAFLWPADLAVPEERGERGKRPGAGEGRAREPRHGRPEGRPGKGGKRKAD